MEIIDNRMDIAEAEKIENVGLSPGHDTPVGMISIKRQVKKYKKQMTLIGYGILHIVVGIYFGFATNQFIAQENTNKTEYTEDGTCWGKCGIQFCNGYGLLLLIVFLAYVSLGYYYFAKQYILRFIQSSSGQIFFGIVNNRKAKTALLILVVLLFATFLYFETKDSPQKLKSLVAPIVFIVCGYVFSTDRKAIKWRTVLIGVTAQFLLGVVCIRWSVGRSVFQCVGDKVATFLGFTNSGSSFIFGDELIKQQIFAFAILPVIFFFSFFISVLYYLNVMQWVIMKLGWILQSLLGTTVCESVIAAANIFLGMSESPLLIRPYLNILTKSELHAIMCSGFATVSGTVLAAYISFGADPALLITSSVMAAPGALSMAKLYFPESEESNTTASNIQMEPSTDTSILDAACKGASNAIEIVLGIVANLVAFVSFIAFINAFVKWMAYLVGESDITFEWIFAKLFIPLSWALGIDWDDCESVAKVIATKTIINEFVAYERLGYYKNNTLITPRSAAIATFAICGFANPSSLGILIGTLSAMAPSRRSTITEVAIRAFIVGCIICFVSASFAGLLITDESTVNIKTHLLPRSAAIATFAICGFANPSSLGILIGTLSAMAPSRRSTITEVAIRAFIVGCIICFVSASFAGLLITDESTVNIKTHLLVSVNEHSTMEL